MVLVEGVSDRILFEALFEKFGNGDASGTTLEVIDIGGKGLFKSYAKLLKACNVPFSIIADLDHIDTIGTTEIKKTLCNKRTENQNRRVGQPEEQGCCNTSASN